MIHDAPQYHMHTIPIVPTRRQIQRLNELRRLVQIVQQACSTQAMLASQGHDVSLSALVGGSAYAERDLDGEVDRLMEHEFLRDVPRSLLLETIVEQRNSLVWMAGDLPEIVEIPDGFSGDDLLTLVDEQTVGIQGVPGGISAEAHLLPRWAYSAWVISVGRQDPAPGLDLTETSFTSWCMVQYDQNGWTLFVRVRWDAWRTGVLSPLAYGLLEFGTQKSYDKLRNSAQVISERALDVPILPEVCELLGIALSSAD